MNKLPVKLRDTTIDDVPFITSSWLLSYRNSGNTRVIPNDLYFKHQDNLIKTLLATKQSLVVCMEDDPTHILGYIVFEPSIIHYLYIKQPFRMNGFARSLIQAAAPNAMSLTITHYSRSVSYIKNIKITYNPYIL